MTTIFPHIQLQTATSCSLTIRYGLGQFLRGIRLEAEGGGQNSNVETTEYNAAGRITLEGLSPDTEYRLTVSHEGRILSQFIARTLPERNQKPLHIAIIGDPHLTMTRLNRNGRLHEESVIILKETIDDITARGCELLLVAGDLTDAGTPDEYNKAIEILSRFSGKILAVPGNHDAVEGRIKEWRRRQIPETFLEQMNGIQFVGINTGEECLHTEENQRIVDAVNPDLPVVALSHYQFFPDAHMIDSDRAAKDILQNDPLVGKIASWKGIAYIGHKNTAMAVKAGRLLNINVPQTLHYPAGWLEADVFPNGIRHSFRPLFSEALHEYSRLGTARLSVKDGMSFDRFRDAAAPGLWNMSYDWEKNELTTAIPVPNEALSIR